MADKKKIFDIVPVESVAFPVEKNPAEQQKISFFDIPTTTQFTITHQAMGATVEGVETYGKRKEHITEGSSFIVTPAKNEGELDITYKTKKGGTKTFTIPDTSHVNVATQNIYPYLVIKALKTCINSGVLYSDTLSVRASELVNIGLYGTLQSARVALAATVDPLMSIRIGCTEEGQEEDKKDPKSIKKRSLFPSVDYEEGALSVQLNNKMDWKAFTESWGSVPSYVFFLTLKARNLALEIFRLLRQHCTDRKCIRTTPTGEKYLTINIKFKTVLTAMHLPSVYTTNKEGHTVLTRKGYERIKQPIELAVAEIEEAHRKTYKNRDFQLLLKVDDNLRIDRWVDEGYLQVRVMGEFYNLYKLIIDSKITRIENNTKRREAIVDKAKAIALSKDLEQENSEQASKS